ncbi:MAG: hypothetical protein QCI82_05660 [Candidatus Thermoplasmatota archaeon]|nr:hypothetical protein [Candidatus Thermoplasmatota archaeon]
MMKKNLIMALAIIWALLFVIPNVNAVNSFGTTCPTNKDGYKTMRSGINKYNDALNDYYNDYGQQHLKDTNGKDAADLIAYIQKYQFQNLAIITHGYTASSREGKEIDMGDGTTNEILDVVQLTGSQGIQRAGKTGYQYSALPFGAINILACESGKTTNTPNWLTTFQTSLGAWIVITTPNIEWASQHKNFIETFADKITDGKKSYKTAIEDGVKNAALRSIFRSYTIRYYYRTGLDHDTRLDKYRYIDRHEGGETCWLNEGSSVEWSFTRSYSKNSNGGYIVFHGIIDNDEDSLTKDANVKIRYFVKENGIFNEKTPQTTATTFNDIKNREHRLFQKSYYGGTDICSYYLTASFMKSTVGSKEFKIRIDNINDNDGVTDNIYIDRFEFMEIGN